MWTASWRFGIYGALIDSAGAATFSLRYRWTGREYDQETGFCYFRARYYDPAAQRFVQEDPIGFGGGPNLYAYGDGNPTNGRDAAGLRFSWEKYAINFGPFAGLDHPDGSTSEWQWVSDGNGGGEWMPPGMSAEQQVTFQEGVVGMGKVVADNTVYVVTIATPGGGTVTVETSSEEVAMGVVLGNLGPRNEADYGRSVLENAGWAFVPIEAWRYSKDWVGNQPENITFMSQDNKGGWGTWSLDLRKVSDEFKWNSKTWDMPAGVGYYTGTFMSIFYPYTNAQGWVFYNSGYGYFRAIPIEGPHWYAM